MKNTLFLVLGCAAAVAVIAGCSGNKKAEAAAAEELAKQEEAWRKAQKGKLTQDQADALDGARKLAKAKLDAGEVEVAKEEAEQERSRRKAEVDAMVEYLKEYGSFQPYSPAREDTRYIPL